MLQTATLNPEFRNKTDLLFFSDRLDIDLTNYKNLFKEDSSAHDYLLDRFFKGIEIYWDNSSSLWNHRLEVIFSLENPAISRVVEKYICKRLFTSLRKNPEITKSHVEYIQYLELCKVKFRRKESLSNFRNYLLDLPDAIQPNKVISIIESFIPYVFKDLIEYSNYLCKRVIYSTRNFLILKELEGKGIKYNIEVLKERFDLILDCDACQKTAKAFIVLLNDNEVVSHFKQTLSPLKIKKVIELLNQLSFKELEANNHFVFKALTDIDSSFIEPLLNCYIIQLLTRGSKHIKSNCSRIAKLNKNVPIFSSKEIFRHLLSINNISYIKNLCPHFPEFKQLIAFV